MPTASITAVYAAALALLIVALMLRVVRLRWRLRIGIGSGEDRVLARAVRAHANAIETVPLALLLMLPSSIRLLSEGSRPLRVVREEQPA